MLGVFKTMLEKSLKFFLRDKYRGSLTYLSVILFLVIEGPVFQESGSKKDSVMTSGFFSGKMVFTLLTRIITFHI